MAQIPFTVLARTAKLIGQEKFVQAIKKNEHLKKSKIELTAIETNKSELLKAEKDCKLSRAEFIEQD